MAASFAPTFDQGTPIATDATSNSDRYRLAIGDLNNDGLPDIAIAHAFRTAGLIFNHGGETFSAETVFSEPSWNVAANIGATSVAIADLDGDGNQDLVITIYGSHYTGNMVQLFRGNGDGTFAFWPVDGIGNDGIVDGIVRTNSANPMASVIADFNHDGRPDLAVSHNNGGWLLDVLAQSADGTFSIQDADQAGQNPQFLATGDFNEDGYTDVAAGVLYTGLLVFTNNGNGTLTQVGGAHSPSHHHYIAVADFDGDGHQDIAARGEGDAQVYVYYGDGTGLFPRTSTFLVSGRDGLIAAGDLDGDGRTDLVVASQSSQSVDLLMNDGAGGFQPAQTIALDARPNSVALADFNGDGALDIALGRDDFTIQVLWNRSVLIGTAGDDTLEGTDGTETIRGLGGNDTLSGLGGADTLTGGDGNDSLDGGAGWDTADYDDRSKPVVLVLNDSSDGTATLGLEQDILRSIESAIGSGRADVLRGNSEANNFAGGAGDDTLQGGGGLDTLRGGYGSDTADYHEKTASVTVDLAASGIVLVGGIAEDTIDDIESIIGGSAADSLRGNQSDNVFRGREGDDVLYAFGGNDDVQGGAGNDRLAGGLGTDTLRGGSGDDTYINPRAGEDTVIESDNGGIDTIQSDISFSLRDIANVERLDLTGTADIDATGSDNHDFISGNAGDNRLFGGVGRDTINAGAGDDTLIGGKGNDRLSGGEGADVFVFAQSVTNVDLIKDFSVAEDRFDLAGGLFTAVSDNGARTKLTHAGGTVLVQGVTGLTLDDWNALVQSASGALPAEDSGTFLASYPGLSDFPFA